MGVLRGEVAGHISFLGGNWEKLAIFRGGVWSENLSSTRWWV